MSRDDIRYSIEGLLLLAMAAAKNPTAVTSLIAQMIPKVLWEVGVDDHNDPSYVNVGRSWNTNPDTWESARATLAGIITG